MSQAEPFPDDPELPDPLLRVEQELGSHKPRPVSWDAEAILKVALEPNRGDECRPSLFASPSKGRSSTWIAVSSSWIGGALAGSLVTAWLMAPPADSEVSVVSGPNSAPHTEVVVDKEVGQRARIPAPRDEQRASAPRWTADDYVVANRIMSLGFTIPGGMTLQAGSYVRLSSTHGVWLTRSSDALKSPQADRAIAPSFGIERSSSSARDRDQLLQELLGSDGVSTL